MSSVLENITSSSETPYPAWLFSTALLATFTSQNNKVQAVQPAQASSGGLMSMFRRSAKVGIKPSPLSCIGFGGAMALGGWIVRDGAVDDGAGFNMAWSTLYLLVNGGASVRQIIRGKIWPLCLTGLALGNLGIYGRRFVYGEEEKLL
ncbi:hypothetical protein BABINDRAFT_33932 [Babjeviella inositovora NRRL Y-12698]|uniref:Uncharacterized protein n=1 Tax=Babjeviella inositovora NRRL Y-12698 TaxID=984486 RepID=A0A1E3QT79_9ASCO|nr:uncharacterized protein BABINDRAFT_33932 [Babjeviella inositovora NRRL Y-12698]ODQ80916.1 hypothetical protein BABINDRAFT_33932 [Babjeviella inositovora NRRL Y-12698]